MSLSSVDLLRAPLEVGTLLVAMPPLTDPHFSQTVVLLCTVDPEGVMGLVINRPSTLTLDDVLEDTELLGNREHRVYEGGPVQTDRILLLRQGGDVLKDFAGLFGTTSLGGSPNALKEAMTGAGIVGDFRAYIGHAGWGMGQLESEIEDNAWALLPPDDATVFAEKPEMMWPNQMAKLGGRLAVYATMPHDLSQN